MWTYDEFVTSFPSTKSFFKHMEKSFIGFDKVMDDLYSTTTTPAYPPYNVKKIDGGYRLEIAVAGFSKDQLNVSVEGDVLTIKGSGSNNGDKDDTEYVHQGIAARAFTLSFRMNSAAMVRSAKLKNGMLTVIFESEKSVGAETIEIEEGNDNV